MKKLLLFALFIPIFCSAQKKRVDWNQVFDGNSIATYSLMGAAGISDALVDCIIANKFYSAPFWGYADWQEHGNLDGFHVMKGASYVFFAGAVAIKFGEKQNWKTIVTEGLTGLAISRLTHELTYNVVFKNYPK